MKDGPPFCPLAEVLAFLFTEDVTLDVDRVSEFLVLSDDLSCVQCGLINQKPKGHAENFDCAGCVLGSPSFTFGGHSREGDLGTSTQWDLGVAQESFHLQQQVQLSTDPRFWTVSWRKEDPSQPALCLQLRCA